MTELMIFDELSRDSVIAAAAAGRLSEAKRGLIRFCEKYGVTDNAFFEYVAVRLADCGNVFEDAARDGIIGDDLYAAALDDIKAVFSEVLSRSVDYAPSRLFGGYSKSYTDSVRAMTAAKTPEELLQRLIQHFRTCGSGVLSRYNAFSYSGELEGIESADPITFDDLIGLDEQKRILCENTESLLSGRRANNVLLFGDRGMGKSSCVKALLNMYSDRGLRVVELAKEHISDMCAISARLSRSPHKYIIYLDDLTFERHEKDYRALKTAMEGQLSANPSNVIIYATSNRRHLIKETWADREGGEVHKNDNMQETLSLAERFGITLTFSAPTNQKDYLLIVAGLLKKQGIEMTDEIGRAAVVWQMNYGGRSGRCATQFAAAYTGKETTDE